MDHRWPNFLIVGAAKSGTTSLYHYLAQHPEVFMSEPKEPLFFCSHGVDTARLATELYPVRLEDVVRELDDYRALFAEAAGRRARGEASVYYLPDHAKTIPNLQRLHPRWRELKIVMILRNPVEAAFSHYQMYGPYIRHVLKQDPLPAFEESLELESARLAQGYRALPHFHWFMYHSQVRAYLEAFRHVKIFLYDDLRADPGRLMGELFEFLGVDPAFRPSRTGEIYNVSGIPRSGFIYRLLASDSPLRKRIGRLARPLLSDERKLRLINWALTRNLEKPVMPPAMRARLREYYRSDVERLQRLIGRDLGKWTAS